MKERIDIEELLVWAYRDMEAEKVAALRDVPASKLETSWGAVDRAVTLGAVIRGSRHELLAGDCDDAAIIHAAVLALDTAFVALDPEHGETVVLDRAMIEAEGGRVEALRGECAVMTAADGSETVLRSLVVSVDLIRHARTASRPDCYADIARRRGRPAKDGEIAPGLTYDEVMFARAAYSVWHAALGILAVDLADMLARWAPTGPQVDESPWLRATGRVLEAIRPHNSIGDKPLKRKRKLRA